MAAGIWPKAVVVWVEDSELKNICLAKGLSLGST